MDPVQLVQTINSFYDQAFNRLLVITFGVIAFIGVFVPLVTGWLQLRSLRGEKASLLAELRLQLDAEREDLAKEIEKDVEARFSEIQVAHEAKINDLSERLEIAYAVTEARTFHLQGRSTLDNHPHLSIPDFCYATVGYIKAKEEANAQTCARLIIEDCLPRISSEQYRTSKAESLCIDLLRCLRENNENGRYQHFMEGIERAMEAAADRKPATNNVSQLSER